VPRPHELRSPSIVAITRPVNLGSQRVLVKTGLVYERTSPLRRCRISCIGRSRNYDVWARGGLPNRRSLEHLLRDSS